MKTPERSRQDAVAALREQGSNVFTKTICGGRYTILIVIPHLDNEVPAHDAVDVCTELRAELASAGEVFAKFARS